VIICPNFISNHFWFL